MGIHLGTRALRIAVKDNRSNQIILETLERVLYGAMRA
jgi:histidinol-phosphate/aromatic aminotransferase/cobyric acid decarboxylase-like protein